MKLLRHIFLKNRSYSIINIAGLALGIACTTIVFLMINYLTNIDTYHQNKDRIYRVVTRSLNNGHEDYNSGVPVPLPEAIKNDFSEIEMVAPVFNIRSGRVRIRKSEKIFEENDGIAYCDSRLYQILDRQWTSGNKETSLEGPNKVVLSESWALKYFQTLDVIGESLNIEGIGDMIITGVMEDYPKGLTDFPFEMLISYATGQEGFDGFGGWQSTYSDFQCYVLLSKGEEIESLEAAMPAFADKYYGPDRTDKRTHTFQPLSDLHFNENYSNFRFKTINRSNILVMILLGTFLIIIACINFINLSTAQASSRSKEVGIRKVLGSTRRSLVLRFLTETFLITCLALVLALGLTELSLIRINSFLDLNLSVDLMGSSRVWIFFILLLIVVTLGAGLYPGILISKHHPADTLKGDKGVSGGAWRKGLVIFQFFISHILIIGSLIVLNQLNFYRNTPLGFEKEGIINVSLPVKDRLRMNSFYNLLKMAPEVKEVSFSWGPPAWGGVSTTNVYYDLPENERKEFNAQVKMCDDKYIDLFDLKLLSGEGLAPSDTASRAVVNMTFVKAMGLEDPSLALNQVINIWGRDLPVSGVVSDFHTLSFKQQIEPVILYVDPSRYEIAAVRLTSMAGLQGSLNKIENSYNVVYPEYSFDYTFMDETFANFYRGEEKMSEILLVFSSIAVFIACIGLYGLVSFIATHRTKEIGIRKVLGASVFSVIYGFSREFTLLIMVAFLVAAPLVYFGMNSWLNQFAYHIDISPSTFLAGSGITLGIALITIAYKAVKASLINPVEALREE